MKKKYGIGIFVILFMCTVIGVGSGYYYFEQREKIAEEEILSQQEASMEQPESSVAADGQALKEDCFYLLEVNGYVVVYLSDKKTAYEYTDVLYEDLPESLKTEIKNGKYVESLDELYGFLENYSS